MPEITATPLASGSRGNSILVESNKVRVLVDAGLSCKEICRRLNSIDVDPGSIRAILVTHEHIDHIAAIPVFTRRFGTPVYTTRLTATALSRGGSLSENVKKIEIINAGQPFAIEDFQIHPFAISHDAADPLGFRFEVGGAALATCSDLGIVTRLVCDRLSHCQAVFCESNHDPGMLKNGPYPPFVKSRVAGKFGHLSNNECKNLIENIYHSGLENIVLSHLSQNNNTPRLAFDKTKDFLDKIGAKTDLKVAFQDKVGNTIEIG